MKTLEFKNNQIAQLYNTLEATVLEQGTARRGKGKLQKALIKADKEYQENKKEILEDYFEQDDKGKLVKDKDGAYVTNKGKSYTEGMEKLQELHEEEFKVDVLTYDKKLKAFYDKFSADEFTVARDKEFSDAAFDTLLDAMEDVFEKQTDKENA